MNVFADLSVLIVSWNQAERLAACLEAVLRFLPGAQVVAVDNGSEPPLRFPAGVSAVRIRENLGYAGGNQAGFVRCTRPFVLLLNNDALLPSAAPVQTLLAFLKEHACVAAAQAALRLPDGSLDACGECFTPAGVLFHRGYRQPVGRWLDAPAPVLAGKGACLLVRRQAVEQAGGLFRPDFFCYYEDIDLGHRLWLAGYEVWFVPTEPVLHDERATSRTLSDRFVWRHYLSNMLSSALDLWGWRAWVRMGPGFLCACLIGACAKGVLPRIRRKHLPFRRAAAERDFLPRVTVRVPWRYYFGLGRRVLTGSMRSFASGKKKSVDIFR